MPSRKKARHARFRVGRVSVYLHHGAWWIYYRNEKKQVRRKVGANRDQAEQVAAQVNGQLSSGTPTLLAFDPIGVPDLRQRFLDYHEHVLRSSLATIRRYRAATKHLADFAVTQPRGLQAHALGAEAFAAYLRQIEVAPNGHPNAKKRTLRDKGVQFVLETCRAMYAYAGKHRHLPPYVGNPFGELPLDRLKIQDAKPVFVFDADSELAFLKAAGPWEFAIHFTLSKTGLRVGELIHLLIEEVNLEVGWLQIRNKTALGWRVKTGNERDVPLLPEGIAVLRKVIGQRKAGPVFLRHRFFQGDEPELACGRAGLERACLERLRRLDQGSSRSLTARVAREVWRDAGAVKADRIRLSFIRLMRTVGHPEATCPKSWRHSLATLLQDANVDPLVRQITLGHRPTSGPTLGMTAHYTHTRQETQRRQIEQALRLWPKSLELAFNFANGGHQ